MEIYLSFIFQLVDFYMFVCNLLKFKHLIYNLSLRFPYLNCLKPIFIEAEFVNEMCL